MMSSVEELKRAEIGRADAQGRAYGKEMAGEAKIKVLRDGIETARRQAYSIQEIATRSEQQDEMTPDDRLQKVTEELEYLKGFLAEVARP